MSIWWKAVQSGSIPLSQLAEFLPSCSKHTSDGTLIYCLVAPKASRTEIIGLQGNPARLKIKLAAPPVDGAANDALIAFLAKELKVPKSRLEIISGHTAKQKTVLVQSTTI